MPPIKLTDDEMNAVYAACRPLPVADRDAFLQALADALRQRGEIGPGVVFFWKIVLPSCISRLQNVGCRSVQELTGLRARRSLIL
jgi:hypothetical protein